MASKVIATEVLDVLRSVRTEGNAVFLPDRLDRKLYLAVNEVLNTLGGVWDKKAKAHCFQEPADEMLSEIIALGTIETIADRKKLFQQFFTPTKLAQEMVASVLKKFPPATPVALLEPSAGEGSLIDAVIGYVGNTTVTAYELDTQYARALKEKYQHNEEVTINETDFLTVLPKPIYDVVVMNPPFTRQQDIEHVRHAFDFLKPGGILIAIVSPSFTFRTDRKTQMFKDFLHSDEVESYTYDNNDAGAFKESGTMVNTVMLEIHKR